MSKNSTVGTADVAVLALAVTFSPLASPGMLNGKPGDDRDQTVGSPRHVGTMRKYLTLTAMLLCLFVGWAHFPACAAQVEPVVFAHPDEVVKGEGFMVLADRRIFAVMAFLNAAGYDEEAKGQQMHPVRIKVRQMVATRLAEYQKELRLWRDYYKKMKFGTFVYQDFALSLSADYPFKKIRPDEESRYPSAAKKLTDFPRVLNEFWVKADLGGAWKQVLPDYLAELKKYDLARLNREMDFLWDFLKMKRTDSYILVNIPNLLETHFLGIGAQYENSYYTVESPGSHSYGLNIHEYLHSIINPLFKAHYKTYEKKLLEYYVKGKNLPMSKFYQNPATFAPECLVRAVDGRLRVKLMDDPVRIKKTEEWIAEQTRQGLTLTQPFYLLLAEYEKSGKSFDGFLSVMLKQLPKSTS